MTCTDIVCGTGIHNPQPPTDPGHPGDPSGGMTLTANAAYGGIRVSWTYPSVNPHTVAHFLLYRSLTSDPVSANEIATVSGNQFLDSIAEATTYYYWIKVVSIYGTIGALIGPASATSRDRGADTIDDVQGRIVDGVLDTALRQDIARITLNYQELMTEIGNRVAGNAALSAALAELQNGLEEAVAFVNTEITTRQEGDSALASEVQIIAAANAANASAIIQERTARVSKDEALTTQYDAVFAATRNNAAAITSEVTARTTADSALANQVNTVQSTLGEQIASVQVGAQTQIGQLNGKVAEIGALWTARVSVNGLVGGFGIYNNGQYVEAGFDVDTFWVGRTTADKIKPFVIHNGVTYIDALKLPSGSVTSMAYGEGSAYSPQTDVSPATCYLTMIAGSSGVVVSGTANIANYSSGSVIGVFVGLYANGELITWSYTSLVPNMSTNLSITGLHSNPSAGQNSYSLRLLSDNAYPGSFHTRQATITATGGKR